MTVARGQIVPKNRLVGSQLKSINRLGNPLALSGPSGADQVRSLGGMGMVSFPTIIHHIEYWHKDTTTGSPTLIIMARKVTQSLAEIASYLDGTPTVDTFHTILFQGTLTSANDDQLNAVDLTDFTDEERTLAEGEELVAVMRGDLGAWVCAELKINALGRESTPTNSV